MNKKIFVTTFLLMLFAFSGLVVAQSNNPVIRMSVSSYDPLPVEPGRNVDVWINVQNIGVTDATGLNIEFLESNVFSLISKEDSMVVIPVLGSFKDYSLKYTFMVSKDAPEGVGELNFKYTIDNQPGLESMINLKVDIKSTEAPISISNVRINPDPMVPGSSSNVVVSVKNLGASSTIRNVNVNMILFQSSATGVIDLPFAPVDSSNQKSISRILPGQTSEFTFNLMPYPGADGGIYKIPVIISYYDDLGRYFEKNSFITLRVNSVPELFVNLESISLNTKVKSGEVMFDVINKGVTGVKLLSVTLLDSNGFELSSSSNKAYLGNIESDDFKTARYRINALDDNLEFKLLVEYRDSLNNVHSESFMVNYTLKESSNGSGSGSTIIIVLVILALAFYFWRRHKKKSKNNK